MADHMDHLKGLFCYKLLDFDPLVEDVVVAYTNASGIGLGLWFPHENFTGQCQLPTDPPKDTIYFFKALVVCLAIHFIPNMTEIPSKMLIYTDNSNTVAMFNSLRAHPPYNTILLVAVDILQQYDVDLWAEFIPGYSNRVVDTLSWFQNKHLLMLAPAASFFDFEPPWNALGAVKK